MRIDLIDHRSINAKKHVQTKREQILMLRLQQIWSHIILIIHLCTHLMHSQRSPKHMIFGFQACLLIQIMVRIFDLKIPFLILELRGVDVAFSQEKQSPSHIYYSIFNKFSKFIFCEYLISFLFDCLKQSNVTSSSNEALSQA